MSREVKDIAEEYWIKKTGAQNSKELQEVKRLLGLGYTLRKVKRTLIARRYIDGE